MERLKADIPEMFDHDGDELHLLKEIFRTYQVVVSSFARMTGMPASRFALLRLLATSDENLGVTDLARQLEINSAAVSRLIKELESEKIVERKADEKDLRRNYITLSSKGLELFRKIHARSHEIERLLVSEINEAELTQASETLEKLRSFIQNLQPS